MQAALPSAPIENIGILLLDAKSDQLYSRYRRDFEVFAGEEAEVFALLPQQITERAKLLGAHKCLEWMESTLSNVLRISERNSVMCSTSTRHCASCTTKTFDLRC